jgi:Bacterial membrane protein YfhO
LRAVQGLRTVAARRPWLVCGLVLAALIAWLLSDALFSSKVLGAEDVLLAQTPFAEAHIASLPRVSNMDLSDTIYQMHPDMLFARDALRHLQLPVWSPWIGAGEPLLATEQHSILFPINLIAVVFPFWQSLEWLAALKLLAAGLGTLLFARRLGLRPLAGLLAAISFTFCSFLVDWLEHPLVNAWSLMPLMFWMADRLAAEVKVRDAGILAALIGFALLGGNPQSAVIAIVPPTLWFATQLVRRRHAVAVPRALALYGLAAVLGLMLAAVVLVPFAEMAGQSSELTRSGGPYTLNYLFGLVTPELWGRPDKFQISGGPFNYFERTAYLGAVPLILAVAGLAIRRTAAQVFFALLGAASLGLVVKIPVYSHLVSGLPVLERMNRGRWWIVVCFCGAMLAAYGLHHLLELEGKLRRRVMTAVAAAVAALPLLWLIPHHDVLSSLGTALGQLPNIQRDPPLPRPALQLATMLRWALFAGIGVALIAAAAWLPKRRQVLACALIAVTAFELVSFQRGIHPATPLAWANPPEPWLVGQIRGRIGHERMGGLVEFQPNLGNRFDLRDVRKYELPNLKRREELWQGLGAYYAAGQMLLAPDQTRAADLFSVRWVISYALSQTRDKRWQPTGVAPIVENKLAFPRAWVAYDWRPAANESDALAQVTQAPDSAAYRSPVIEHVAAPAAGGSPPQPTPAHFETDGVKGMRLDVDAERPGRLILNDTWYPGWKATVDGRSVPIEHANVAFRAVQVPAGKHLVEFTYRPSSVRIGEVVSVLAALAIALLILSPSGIRGYRFRRRGSPATSADDRP